MGRYNPNHPTVLGNEFAPVSTAPVTIDTGTAFGYTFRTQSKEDVQTARVLTAEPPPGQPFRKVISAEVYYDGGTAPRSGPMRKIIVPVSSGAAVTGAALSGAATFQDALKNPTDAAHVTLTGPSAACRLWFDTSLTNVRLSSVLLNNRVADVSVRYLITGGWSDYALPVKMSLERPSAAVVYDMDYSLTGPAESNENLVPRRSRLGDYNPFWNTTINPNSDYRRHRWQHRNGSANFTGLEALQSSAGTNIALRFQTSPDVAAGVLAFRVQYVALEITYCGESRVASGALDLSGGVGLNEELFTYDIPLMSASAGFPWDSNENYDYIAVVGQGYVGALSVTYPVPVTVPRLVPGRDTFNGHKGVVIRKTLRVGEEWTREETDSVPAVALFASTTVFDSTTIYPPSQVYQAPLATAVAQLTFSGDASARVIDDIAGRTYTQVRFYARRYPGVLDYLAVRQADPVTGNNLTSGSRAFLTVEAFDALPEIANGWKEVTLDLDPPYVSVGGSVVTRWNFDASTDPDIPWEVLGVEVNPYQETAGAYSAATYGGTTAFATDENNDDINADFALMLIESMPVPANLTVTPAVQALALVDEACGLPVTAIPTGIRYHQLSWDPVNTLAVAGFAYYEVQRRDTTMPPDEWETVAAVTAVTTTDADDYEARVGVVSSYRVRMVHQDGYTSAWSTVATGTITAPGVTGTGVDSSVLILTSNHDPAGNLAHVMVWDGDAAPPQEFSYAEGGQTTLQRMYNRDYAVAFRPLERGGVSFTRTLMLNALGVPTLTLDRTANPLRNLAWDTLPYVCTRDQASNRWLTTLEVPSSVTRDIPSAGHLVLAPVTFTEVTATPAPVDYEGTCQGTRLEGADYYQYWFAPAPAAAYGTRIMTDGFTRNVADGTWGTAPTGQVWSASGGGAVGDYTVNGTQARIVSNTVTVDRRQFVNATFDFHRTKFSFTVPAVATGAAYNVAYACRYQDSSNHYLVKVEFTTGGQYRMDLVKMQAGVATNLVVGANIAAYAAGNKLWLEVMVRGTTLTARVWKDGSAVPAWDEFSESVKHVQDASLATTGRIAIQQTRATANTNAALSVLYDDLTVDRLVKDYDWRVLVRPYADAFDVAYGVDEFSNNSDSEGGWNVRLSYGQVELLTYGRSSTQVSSTKLTELGLVKNRETWIRITTNQDSGTGSLTALFYTSEDGAAWTLVDTVTKTAPTQPVPPLAPGAYVQVENFQPGGIWTKRYELRLDGVLALSPDFAAQPVGTESFTDSQALLWTGPADRGICSSLED